MTDQQGEQAHNLLVSILVFVRGSYLYNISMNRNELWRVAINNIILVFRYEYDGCFKLLMWVEFPWY